MKSVTQLTPKSLRKSIFWKLALILAAVLFVVFIVASVSLIRTAISSQPACVMHERVGTNAGSLSTPAAKSAC